MANVVVTLLLFLSIQPNFTRDAGHDQADNTTMTLSNGIKSFRHHMHMLISQRSLPHTKAEQEQDLNKTKLELLNLIRSYFPLEEGDKRKENVAQMAITTLKRLKATLTSSKLSKEEKSAIAELLTSINRALGS